MASVLFGTQALLDKCHPWAACLFHLGQRPVRKRTHPFQEEATTARWNPSIDLFFTQNEAPTPPLAPSGWLQRMCGPSACSLNSFAHPLLLYLCMSGSFACRMCRQVGALSQFVRSSLHVRSCSVRPWIESQLLLCMLLTLDLMRPRMSLL